MLNYETLQRKARDTYGLDAQGALRAASGLNLDIGGVVQAYPDPLALLGEGYSSGNGAVNEPALLTRIQASTGTGSPVPQAPTIDSSGRLVFVLSTGTSYSDAQRDMWVYSGTATNVRFKVTIQPDNFGTVGADTFAPQAGVCLRVQNLAGTYYAITINNNIVFGDPFPNIGVWKWTAGGAAGFANRQYSWPQADDIPLPYVLEGTLVGNTVYCNIHAIGAEPNWASSTFTKTINLDTQAGSTAGFLTPTLPGAYGYLVGHSTALVPGAVKIGPTHISKLS